jgi:hypothetical protein
MELGFVVSERNITKLGFQPKYNFVEPKHRNYNYLDHGKLPHLINSTIMKSLYASLAFALIANLCSAQSLVYSTDQHIESENLSGTYESYDIKFTTPQLQGITYAWTLISNSLPTDWTYSLCDYTGCYPGAPASGTMTAISQSEAQNGVEGFFKLTLSPLDITGDGVLELFVYDSGNPTVGDTVSFHIWHTSTTAGINDLSAIDHIVYPNPATDIVNISSASTNGYVSNVLGQKLLTVTKNNNHTIDVSNWKAGVYFYSTQINGQSITTRFIVK